MADPLVAYDDIEMFLVNWYRQALAGRPEPFCQNVWVDNKEPTGTFPAKLVVIRDDGGPDTSFLTGERSFVLSVLAGTKSNPQPANELARVVHALRSQIPSPEPDNPVAAVIDSNGPYPVSEAQDRARRYITFTLSVVATAL